MGLTLAHVKLGVLEIKMLEYHTMLQSEIKGSPSASKRQVI